MPNFHYINIKFGGSVWDHHTHVYEQDVLVLAVVNADCQTTKLDSPPNFPAIQ